MATGMQVWSKTAASNSTADANVNWAEGMAPSAVNDSARAEMASAAKWRDDNNGSLSGTLSTATYSVTSNQVAAALTAGYTIAFQLGSDIPATALLNLDTLGAKPLRPVPGTDYIGGEHKSGTIIRATYFTSNSGEWIVMGYRSLAAGEVGTTALASNAVTTAKITDANVTLAKIASIGNNTVLGNISGSSAAPAALALVGPTGSGSTLTFPFPVPGSFKNLSVKVASSTTVTVAADFVTTTDGTNYQSTAVSATVNLGTNGAVNALDTGTIASATWYAIWVIAKTDGTTGAIASTSGSSPTMPTGYTFKARYGWVRTAPGSAQLLGTWQFGRRAQYVVGLAQTSTAQVMSTSTVGDVSSPTWSAQSVSTFVPTTASEIELHLRCANTAMAAPNASYGASTSTTNPPSIVAVSSNGITQMMLLESTSVYWANNGGAVLSCHGWIDNI